MHTDCIQKFRFSSNENVALPGQHHLGISKKKKEGGAWYCSLFFFDYP